MLLPIRTETSIHRTPVANVLLIGANILVFLFFDFSPTPAGDAIKSRYFVLDGASPAWYQFLTYQFAHGDVIHLVSNMLFLWVFGNGVNGKLGDAPYLLFYLVGGAFAGLVFGGLSDHSLLGASGSIAAVTTGYLVLFPRSRVTVLYVLFLIGVIEVPAMVIIGLKIILWDNILAPQLEGSGSQIAYSAHLAGYLFGFAAALLLLAFRLVQRDQYDLLALMKRWNQRRAFRATMADPQARARAQYGRVARVESVRPDDHDEWNRRMDEQTELRARIAANLRGGRIDEALADHERLVSLDPEQVLPSDQQLAVGREYYARSRSPQAAAAFERFLHSYASSPEANEVRLLLGIISARDLKQYETAREHLTIALERAPNRARRDQAQRWLDIVRQGLAGA